MKEFKLTKKDVADLREAAKPVPYIIIGDCVPDSPQENSNAVWKRLGKKHGFKWDTAEPIPGRGNEYILAEPEK